MRAATRALLGAVLAAGLVAPAGPAHAATIVCRVVKPTYLSGNRVVLRIASSHPDRNRVHSFVVTVDTDFGPQARTHKPVGPNVVVGTGGHPVVWVSGWQSGTRCAGSRG